MEFACIVVQFVDIVLIAKAILIKNNKYFPTMAKLPLLSIMSPTNEWEGIEQWARQERTVGCLSRSTRSPNHLPMILYS